MEYQEWVDLVNKYHVVCKHVTNTVHISATPLTLTYCPAKSTTSDVKQPEASTGQMGTWSLWMILYSMHTR